MTRASEIALIAAFCLAAALRVFIFSAAFPFFNNVDEQAHVDLVLKYARGYWPEQPIERFDPESARLIASYGSPEYMDAAANGALAERIESWTREYDHEAASPPVYYAIAGLWFDLGRALGLREGALLYWIRFLNVPLIALTVFCAYLFCRDYYPGRIDLRLGVPALAAFVPQDVFYTVNSDVLSPLLFAGSLMLLWRWRRRDPPGLAFSAVVGLSVAMTLLVKLTNIALLVVFLSLLVLEIRRSRREGGSGNLWRPASAALMTCALPVAVFLGRNYALFGDPTGTSAKVAFLGWSPRPLGTYLSHPIFTVRGFWTFATDLIMTFWRGELVWHSRRLASPLADDFCAISSIVFGIGAALAWKARRTAARYDPTVHLAVWASVVLSAACLAYLSVYYEYGTSFYPSQAAPFFISGRLIAGMMIPFLVLYVDGAAHPVGPFARVAGPLAVIALTAAILTVSEIALSRDVFASSYNWFHLR